MKGEKSLKDEAPVHISHPVNPKMTGARKTLKEVAGPPMIVV